MKLSDLTPGTRFRLAPSPTIYTMHSLHPGPSATLVTRAGKYKEGDEYLGDEN